MKRGKAAENDRFNRDIKNILRNAEKSKNTTNKWQRRLMIRSCLCWDYTVNLSCAF